MIRVTNRTRDIVTLPAPYQGILMAYRSEVLDTTEAEFVAAIGGLDTAGGVFTIEAVAASVAATVAVDRTITDADLIYAIPNADPIYYAITTNIQVFANSSFGALTVNMTNPDGSDLPEGVIYTIKDVGGDASTHNITVSTPYTVIGGSGDDYIIDTDYASVSFYRSGSSFVPLPGVSSGGGASDTISDPAAMASGPSNFVGTTTVLCDTSSLACTVVLEQPGGVLTLVEGTQYTIKDATGNAATNNITIEAHNMASVIQGSATYVMNTNWQSITVVHDANGNVYIT